MPSLDEWSYWRGRVDERLDGQEKAVLVALEEQEKAVEIALAAQQKALDTALDVVTRERTEHGVSIGQIIGVLGVIVAIAALGTALALA